MLSTLRGWTRLPFWRLNALVWCIFTVLFFLRAHLHFDTSPAFALSFLQLALCIAFSTLLHFCYQRLDLELGLHVRTYAWVVGLSLLATLLQSTIAHVFVSIMEWKSPHSGLLETWILRTMFFWLVYIAWSLFYFWLRAEHAAQEREKHTAEARAEAQRLELQLLRSQLDPHFIFNALNGIATTIPAQPGAASAMVRELADYLRYTLDHRHDSTASLSAELESIDAYLKIEEVRFGDRLQIAIQADEPARRARVPCFLLQPLVENAVKHSFENTTPPWKLEIEAGMHGGSLHLTIRNSGHLAEGIRGGAGVGLDTLKRRLDLQYPGRHTFVLRQERDMVCASLALEGDPCLG